MSFQFYGHMEKFSSYPSSQNSGTEYGRQLSFKYQNQPNKNCGKANLENMLAATAIGIVAQFAAGSLRLVSRHNQNRKQRRQIRRSLSYGLMKISDTIVVPKLSVAALQILVKSQREQHFILDIRSSQEKDRYLLEWLQNCYVKVQLGELTGFLTSETTWKCQFGDKNPPQKDDILIFVASTENLQRMAAAIATGLGYQRCAVLGGQDNFENSVILPNQDAQQDIIVQSVLEDILNQTWPTHKNQLSRTSPLQ
eukprot:TRINITY_DN1449_c1_g1_i1.p1 TRINITY_DN1449_c1_g1~~TRINITY_DN1449_c1_g1_i1.p1  ORF type:complete len:253 (-),score=22.66 TRINITY_DN1449_c1_g1_i1:1652-2410(-)